MVELTRVPAPRSPFDGRWGWLAGLLVVVLVFVVVKPWEEASPVDVDPSPPSSPSASPGFAADLPPDRRAYDPSRLGDTAPEPAWELFAANRRTTIRFVGPGGFEMESPSPTAAEDAIVAGPVIELGTTDELAELAINRPAGTDLGAVRLWRLEDGTRPVRVPLEELEPPWRNSHVRVFAARRPLMPAETVIAWRPGLYRLDLLIEPIDKIRILLLNVRPGPNDAATPDPAPAPEPGEVDLRLLQRLPAEATFWSYGPGLSGWASDRAARGVCSLVEIWQARDYSDPCRPIPVGQPAAIGVNLGEEHAIESITLREVDPLPGPIPLESAVPFEGRQGLAIVRTAEKAIPDGIYRLDVETADGEQVAWYVEASPVVRAE